MQPQHGKNWNGRVLGGLLLLLVGSVLFLKQFGSPFPYWLFTWPMLLIVIGLFLGLRHGFRGPAWAILIMIGSIFLIDLIAPGYSFRKYAAPIIFIAIGLFMIFRPRTGRHQMRNRFRDNWIENDRSIPQPLTEGQQPLGLTESINPSDLSKDDYIDSVAVFGSVRKVIVSKDFKGGDLVSIFGGNEIDLGKADIKGRVVLEVTAILGGIKLILPSDWNVKSEMVAFLGGIEDKRQIPSGATDPGKILVLKGTTVLGGLDIRNY